MVDIASILLCLTLFYLGATSRLKAYVSVLQLQGILLSAIMVLPFVRHLSAYLLVFPIIALVVKGWLVPRYVRKIMLRLGVKHIVEPSIQPANFILLLAGTMCLVFVGAHMLSARIDTLPVPLASSFFAILTGIYIILFRKTLLVHVVGFLVVENGIFLLGWSLATEMPTIVELGGLLDIFVVVFLMSIAINRITATLDAPDVRGLARLRD